METITVTFSLPRKLNRRLHKFAPKRGLSKFVSKAIEQALDDKEDELVAAVREAEKDPDRNELIADWEGLDVEGWDE